jgi:glycosyltransferase involved in cell wall biosynthesis
MSARPIRIAHVTCTANGAPWLIALAVEQRRRGHDVSVILPSLDGNIARELGAAGIPCRVAPTDVLAVPNLSGQARAVAGLVRLLRRLRPDVVHSHILNAVLTARIAAWIADVPNRFSGNVGPLSIEADILRPLEIGTAFCDTRTIASASYTRELMIRHGIPAEQIEVVYYAVDQRGHDPARADGARVRRELGLGPDVPVVGMVAYFYPPGIDLGLGPEYKQRGVKGHDVLLRAVPLVLARVPEARFVLVGRGWGPAGEVYERAMHDLARALGIDQAVRFTGERRDIPDVLAAFDVSTHCSLTDNLAGTVESLLMARPMVVSDIGGFRDTVIHGETGLRVPIDDPPALADAIVRLLRDPALARRLGENGRRRMLAGFTLARVVADHEAILERSPARAEQHYRLRRTVARAVAAPGRLLPALNGMRRAAGFPTVQQQLKWQLQGHIGRFRAWAQI